MRLNLGDRVDKQQRGKERWRLETQAKNVSRQVVQMADYTDQYVLRRRATAGQST
jgi:hypothetical protein